MALERIFKLTQSLSAPEKRYVKAMAVRASASEAPKTSVLLNTIWENMEEDVEAVSVRLLDHTKAKQLPSELNYLYRFMLRALRSFHADKTVDMQLRALLTNSELLLEKRLYTFSIKELKQARALAERHEKYPELLQIIHREADIVIEHQPKSLFEKLNRLVAQAERTMNAMHFTSNMHFASEKAFAFVRTRYQLREDESRKMLTELTENGLTTEPAQTLVAATISFHKIKAAVALCNGDFATVSAIYDKMIALWEADEVRLQEDILDYKKLLSNKLTALHAISSFDQMPAIMEKMRKIPIRSAEEEGEQFQNLTYMELLLRMNTDGFHGFDEFVSGIENGLKKYKSKINQARLLMFFYNIGVSYFILENWKTASTWISKIIEQPRTDHRQDIQHFSRLFRLVLYYEQNKHDLLDYELVNVERYLRQHKVWFTYEATIIKFFKQLLSQNVEPAFLFEKFHTQISELSDQKKTGALPGCAELLLWSRHRFQSRPLRELLRS